MYDQRTTIFASEVENCERELEYVEGNVEGNYYKSCMFVFVECVINIWIYDMVSFSSLI